MDAAELCRPNRLLSRSWRLLGYDPEILPAKHHPKMCRSLYIADICSRKREIWSLIAILALAFGVRAGAAVWWQSRIDGAFRFGDSETYWELAGKLAEGGPYEYGPDRFRVLRTPGYPAILAPLFWIFGDHPPILAARLLGALLGTVAVAVLWWWARSLFGQLAGLIAAALGAIYPGAIVTSVFVLSEAAFCPVMLVNLVLWSQASRASSKRSWAAYAVGAGIAFGSAVLIRPSWLLFLPFAFVFGLVFGPLRKRQTQIAITGLALGIVVLSPWWIRNARVTGHFVPTSLQTGASLYDGLHAGATGASDMRFVPDFLEEERQNSSSEESLEFRLNRRLSEESVAWTRSHPFAAARLAGIKFLRMWNIVPNEPSFSSLSVRAGIVLSYAPVLFFGLIGAILNFRRGFSYMLCWLPAVYFSLLHMIFIGSLRYRQPAMLGFIVLAAGVVAVWVARWRRESPDG